MSWKNNVLQVNESKSGNYYIEIKEDISFEKGERIMLKAKVDDIDDQVNKGFITEEEGESLKEKFDWIKYIGNVAPKG